MLKEFAVDVLLFVVILTGIFALLSLEELPTKKQQKNLKKLCTTITTKKNLNTPKRQIKPNTAPQYIWRKVEVRAYCPCEQCCGSGSPGLTALGTSAYTKGIAGFPVWDYGDEFEVPGYGIARVDDCGGHIKKMHGQGKLYLEIRFQEHQEALEWGIKFFYVKVPVMGVRERTGKANGRESISRRKFRRWRLSRDNPVENP